MTSEYETSPCRCKAPFWPRWDDAEDRVEHMPNRCPLGFQDPPEEMGKAGSEYETRMAQCRASGHQLVPWHIRFFGALYVRLFCSRCSLTFLPVTGGR